MKRLLLLLFSFLCFPRLVLAGQQINFPDLLSPPAIKNGTDQSIHYLQNIFGVVDGVLYGSGSQIMGKMFGVFNAGALILGVAIIVYIIIVGVLQTAAEGETLGKNWSSLWIPFRAVFGIALLVPSGTGYSVIQIFMMWVVVQGVAVADSVWDSALGYLISGGVIVEQAALPQKNLSEEARTIFNSQVCMYGIQKALDMAKQEVDKNQQSSPNRTNLNIPLLASSVLPIIDRDCKTADECKNTNCTPDGKCVVTFPGSLEGIVKADEYKKWKPLEGICGKVEWSKPTAGGNAQLDLTGRLISRDRSIAIQQMILNLQGPAQNAVQIAFTIPSVPNLTESLKQAIRPNVLLDAAAAYQGITKASDSSINRIARVALFEGFKNASAGGWINAGTYYHNLINLNLGVQQTTTPPSATFGSERLSDPTTVKNILTDIVGGGTSINAFTEMALSLNDKKNEFQVFVNNLDLVATEYGGRTRSRITNAPLTNEAVRLGLNAFTAAVTLALAALPPPGQWAPFGILAHALAQAAYAFFDLGNQSSNVNPVLTLALIGHSLMTAAIGTWAVMGVSLTVLTAALGALFGLQVASAVTTAISWFGVFMFPLLIAVFVEGAIMAFYIPLIPFIIFTFASIGWLITVIEAMAAAPLIALGITHPEGSPVLGKADPAVLMLVSVFIRPALMIIGLIAGIIISYVAVWLLGKGIWWAFFSNWQALITNPLNVGFAIASFMLIYILLVISIMNTSFALIENLHNHVMEWIGGRAVGGGEAQNALRDIKSGYEAGVRAAAGGMEAVEKERREIKKGEKATASAGGEGGGGTKNELH